MKVEFIGVVVDGIYNPNHQIRDRTASRSETVGTHGPVRREGHFHTGVV